VSSRNSKIKIPKYALYFAIVIVIVLAKIVRWNFAGDNLIHGAIGKKYLDLIISDSTSPQISIFGINNIKPSIGGANENSIWIYSYTNVFKLDTYISFEIWISIFFNVFLLGLLSKARNPITLLQAVFYLLSVAVLNIFSFTLAKEPIQMLFFLALFGAIKSRMSTHKKIVLVIVILIVTSLIFRFYYVLMIMFFLVTFFILRRLKKIKKYRLLIFCFLFFITYFAFLCFSGVVFPDVHKYFYYLRSSERAEKWNTGIAPLFQIYEGDLFLALDMSFAILRLLLPAELLFRFSTAGFFMNFCVVLYQALITVMVMRGFRRIHKLSQIQFLAFSLYLSFLFMSATFEPDFGSWLRHESVVFPILFAFIDYKKEYKVQCGKQQFIWSGKIIDKANARL
jgi:hypothetical protein